MRILAAHPGPNFSTADVHEGYVEALRAQGHHVAVFNLSERLTFYDSALQEVAPGMFRKALTGPQAQELAVNGLYSALYQMHPDLLLVTAGHFVAGEMLDIARRYGIKVAVILTEQPYELPRELALAAHADVALITDPIHIEQFRAVTTAVHAPHAHRPAIHYRGPARPELVSDFAFVGTGYPSRVSFLEAMDLTGLDVLLAGNWQQLDEDSPLREHVAHGLEDCLENTVTADVYRSAQVGLNLYRREAQAEHLSAGWAIGPREIEMAACGLFFLRDSRPEGDELFPMLPTFDGPDDASEQLHWWLAHPDQRQEAAEKAAAAVQDRTFDHHAAALMRLITKE